MTYVGSSMTIKDVLETPLTDGFVCGLWYDWFCTDRALYNRGVNLLKKLNQIKNSNKFDSEKTYVFLKNCCPLDGSLYDRFSICDIESGDVIYAVTPKSGHRCMNGKGEVYGKENDFKEPLFEGSWKDIKNWFLNK